MEFIEATSQEDSSERGRVLLLKGEWTTRTAAAIIHDISELKSREGAVLDAGAIGRFDTAGAWLLRENFPDATYQNLSTRQRAVLDFVSGEAAATKKNSGTPASPPGKSSFFISVGRRATASFGYGCGVLAFLGEVFTRLGRNLKNPAGFRLPSVARHIRETGLEALPIISLLAFGIAMVISYQGAIQLRKFGADLYTVDVTVISLLREMAVLVTAIMVAGRSGSAFAAEIGVMKMRGEVDALRVMGMDPVETLVAPRLLALMFTLPVLAFVADLVGLAGAGVMAAVELGLTPAAYLARVRDVATPLMFFVGMSKAPVFALLISAVCCFEGMSAEGSAENVGQVTTRAVVQSIFLVIMADALFSILFSAADI
jgi:phospholipid/cholesterol/gamma-HCH transport system permease protein